MENDNISSSSSSESKLPLIVGILGFALGAAGIVLGIQAKRLAVTATDEAAAAKMATSELSNTVATKATKEDILAVRADLDKGLADIANRHQRAQQHRRHQGHQGRHPRRPRRPR